MHMNFFCECMYTSDMLLASFFNYFLKYACCIINDVFDLILNKLFFIYMNKYHINNK